MIGMGVVVRDCDRRILLMVVRWFRARWQATLGKAIAARFGLQLAIQHGFTAIEMEGDAYNLSKVVDLKRNGHSPLDLVVEDIWQMGDSLADFSITHVKRGGNTVAHLIACLHPSNGVEQIFVDNFP